MWCPELSKVPTTYIHSPWVLSKSDQKAMDVMIGQDYPEVLPCSKYTQSTMKTEKFGFTNQQHLNDPNTDSYNNQGRAAKKQQK